ncbi:ferric-dicitrate binding protein FerR, regulates iron transport through sigma-19 [Pedobacter steynii]|uniref:Ferric-dicitrate binding protein FerR, regulates iron transport through sigma-19 n=1 Tax=Pedobacter steynii TaxID=430522 RepID=A0A1G9KFY1_9SPHI|nr:FecR domain-containing protein [Pedobacter steynii]NQX38544.1 FecR domain-containing protein [Pedobacter steynii]SDL48790.1 ferric-dicitrate binding protein FerR, regulates iron transport through sigma-19 [Pedobacter steynii]
MAKKNIFSERRSIDQQAEAWFYRTDDRVPFEAFSNQQEKTKTGEEMLDAIRRKIRTRKHHRLWLNVAAAAVILITSGTFGYRAYLTSAPSIARQVWVSYAANKGEFKEIRLPDQSTIHLRPGAKIAIAQPFIQQNREVKLVAGEIYCEVSHDPEHPFLVHSSQITTQVLGTKFIINNDPLAADIRVTLLSGKVAVRNETVQLGILLPKQQLSFNRVSETVKLDSTTYLVENWLNGEYILDDVPLKSFAQTFGNAFSMEVRFQQKALENLPVSIQFYRTDHPKNILDQLKLIHGLNYQIKGKEVILMR